MLMNLTTAYIALGSNVGDSPNILCQAMAELEKLSAKPLRRSSLWQTTPVDCPPGSPTFVNAAVALFPRIGETPATLLARMLALEKDFGRRPKRVLNEPRRLDLDLIAFGQEVSQRPELILPHPRAHQRRFVLRPLNEIAPELILPGQRDTVAELLVQLVSAEITVRLPA
jgi:2-amino-4-hydroxy-6-hydroxymethyldihydropteridine diphosphokinase